MTRRYAPRAARAGERAKRAIVAGAETPTPTGAAPSAAPDRDLPDLPDLLDGADRLVIELAAGTPGEIAVARLVCVGARMASWHTVVTALVRALPVARGHEVAEFNAQYEALLARARGDGAGAPPRD